MADSPVEAHEWYSQLQGVCNSCELEAELEDFAFVGGSAGAGTDLPSDSLA